MAQTIHAKERGYPSARVLNPFLLRSWLIFPAIKERFINKIVTLKGINKPDVVIFDLEDSVKDTLEAKEKARQITREHLVMDTAFREGLYSRYLVAVRVNNHPSHREKDLELIALINPHMIILPKIQGHKEVWHYQNLFPSQQLSVIIETIQGYENREEVIKSLRPCDSIAIGYEDLSAQLEIEEPTDISQPYPLTHIVNECMISAKKYQRAFVEGPSRKYGSPQHLQELEQQCRIAKTMGYTSKVAIHPSQISIINKHFSKERLKQKASRVLKKFQSLEDDTFVISNDQTMMDTPSYNFYAKILEKLKE